MKNRVVYWFITVTLSALLIYFFVCNVILPLRTKNQFLKTTSYLSVKKEVKKEESKKPSKNVPEGESLESIFANSSKTDQSKLFDLKKSEEFLQSKVKLINDDSSYLVLDLVNKMFTLELKGISLYECQVLNSQISSSIKDQPAESFLSWIAEPFYLKHSDATITKTTLKEMIAPKDSVEANKKDETPRAPKRGDTYVVMDFDRNLRLVINQAEKLDKDGRKSIDSLQWKYRKNEIIDNLQALIHLDREPVKPTIEIVLQKEDATIFYRALPKKPKLLLKL